jgi:stage V sporulation protein B
VSPSSDGDDAPAPVSPEAGPRRAGRGGLALVAAKVLFILAGWSIQIALPRLLRDDATFGLFSVALGAVSILNNVLIASTLQTVSKLTSEDESQAAGTLRRGLSLQLVVGGVLAGALFATAPALAALLLDPALTPLLRIASGVVLAYALYAALVGSLNGRRRFLSQAGLDMTFSLLRTAGILTGAALFGTALATLGGFAVAAGAILLVALGLVGIGRSGPAPVWARWRAFLVPIWLYQIGLNLVLQVDLQVLKRTLAEVALAGGATAEVAASMANLSAAHYRSAQVFAFVPYQLLLSVTFIVFPAISRATAAGDVLETRRTVEAAHRFSVLVLMALAAPVAGAAPGVIGIVYPASYAVAGTALSVLAFGMAAFALFVVGATILGGAGRPGLAARLTAVALVVVLVGTRTLLFAFPEAPLVATAVGTSLGTLTAAVGTAALVRRELGAFLPAATLLRTLAAGAVGFAVAAALPHEGRLETIGTLVVAGLAYLGTLALLRELGREDLAILRRILGR